VGAVNGVLVAVFRYQSIVATLCTFIILGGVNLMLAPSAVSLPANWTSNLAGTIGPVPGGLVLIAAAGLGWAALGRTSCHGSLYAVGGDAAAAYSAGTNVAAVKVTAYCADGLIAGLALVGLVESADPSYGQQYALIAIAAVALGGASLRGGRGGLAGSVLGALAIYLAQNFMLSAHINIEWVQVVYGAFLVLAVALNAAAGQLQRGPSGGGAW
jgi:ribose transport system permease protein